MTLKELRHAKGLSQQQLAEELGVSLSYVNHLESGRRNFTEEIKKKLSRVLLVESADMEQVLQATVKYEPKMHNNWISKLKIFNRPVLEDFVHYVRRDNIHIADMDEFKSEFIEYLNAHLIRSIENELRSDENLTKFIYAEFTRKVK